jgi:predicted nucleic acid-binding protein
VTSWLLDTNVLSELRRPRPERKKARVPVLNP